MHRSLFASRLGLVGLATGVVLALGGTASPGWAAHAKSPTAPASPFPRDVPEALRPWTDWVLHGHERERCPNLSPDGDADDAVCVWAGRLALTLDALGGRFTQEFEVFAPGQVPLPGAAGAWPLDVKVDGQAAVVVARGDSQDSDADSDGPAVALPLGRHAVQGTFAWRRLPESLAIPPSTALLGLTLMGHAVEFPSRSPEGELFLQKQEDDEPAQEEDQLDIAVHRHVVDDVPLLLATRIVLNVSGKTREVVLGKSLPAGFLPHSIEAPIPVRIEADGRLRVQLRPGTWTVLLVARQNAPVAKLQRPTPDGPWKEGDEVWVFSARPDLRTVTVEGVPTIDPQQTTLPDEWKKLPAYLMVAGATMTLKESHRGNADPPVDRLTLQRQLWLDFDGGGFTARDRIAGTFQRGWRLSMGPDSRLGRVSIGGADQFITRLGAEGAEGVEIRQTRAELVAESRFDARHGDIPAVGWAQDFQSVSANLALPPGWRLVHASGADSVSDTWIMHWTLLDLFLLLITGIGIGKVFGWRTGLLALATLGLLFPQDEAPKWIWLAVLVAETLVRALPAGRLRWLAGATRLGTWVLLALFAVPFAVQEIRVALHPALGTDVQTHDRFTQLVARQANKEEQQERQEAPPADVPIAAAASEARNRGADLNDVLGGLSLSGVGSLSGKGGSAYAGKRSAAPAVQNLAAYDPNVIVQTGHGVPSWTWNGVAFTWNGPVERDQRLRLWLLPPWLNLLLGFTRVGLMAALVLLIVGGRRGLSGALHFAGPVVAAALALFATLTPAHAVAAELPNDELLGKLRERLLEKPTCHPNCTSIGRLALEAAPDRLRLRLEVGALAPSAIPLPSQAQHWVPDAVLLDGKPAPTLTRDDDGQLWIQLAAGAHQVVMEGPLPPRETVQIPFKLLPHAVTISAHGWKIDGLTEDGLIDGNLQLSRIVAKPRAATRGERTTQALEAASLPPFVTVERTLELGLKWQVQTRVTRQTSPTAAVVLDVPLLPGESVVSSGVRVVKGRVQVNLGAGETETTWSSTLTERPELVLTAPAPGSASAASWTEAWFVNAGPIWHVSFAGIPPVDTPAVKGERIPGWRPWPGETVKIAVSRPGGTAGQSMTIDHATVTITPGIRSTQTSLSLSLRSSRGGEHTLTLPEGAVVEVVTVNGSNQPPRQDQRRVTVPVVPGAQTIDLAFREPVGLTSLFRAPPLDLGLPAVNVDLSIQLASDRWLLLVGGPRLGPAILFWSFAVVLILVGLALGRTRLAPLSSWQWVLLGLGLSQTPPPAAALVAGALLAFGWRRRLPPLRRAWLHNLGQIAFAFWTVAAVVVLFSAIKQGLLDRPDMGISGNQSHPGLLRWFADRTPGGLPRPWVLSAPLLVYRLFMLAWALWLALAVIRWARWIWECFTHGSLWRARPPKVKPPAAPPPFPAPASEQAE